MNQLGMTTMEVRTHNKNKVYNYIYAKKSTYKLEITKDLEMGLSTVNQNLKLLESEGFICKNGYFDSTGGRKADAIEIVTDRKISIGLAILKESLDIVALNLYGECIHAQTLPIPYEHSEEYYATVGTTIQQFVDKYHLTHILGVSIAIQGVVSNDGTTVSYGAILNNSEMTLSHFTKHIPYPCRMEHDSKAAAALEIWKNQDIQNAAVLLLNRNLGGAIIHNRSVQYGNHMRSGLFEHLTIQEDGELCYCGKRGCLETYCSANALKKASGIEIGRFFDLLLQNDASVMAIWTQYLNHLSDVIKLLYTLIDGKIIISGYLAWFFKETDIAYIVNRVGSSCVFPLEREDIILSKHGNFTQAIGTGLFYIEQFLNNI